MGLQETLRLEVLHQDEPGEAAAPIPQPSKLDVAAAERL
jgi:hypothetical protein